MVMKYIFMCKKYIYYIVAYNVLNLQKAVAVQKNKQCQASLNVRIKRDTKYTRCRDPYVKEGLRAILRIKFQHSHHINVAEAWGWLKRKDETRQTFIKYFNNGKFFLLNIFCLSYLYNFFLISSEVECEKCTYCNIYLLYTVKINILSYIKMHLINKIHRNTKFILNLEIREGQEKQLKK